MAINAGKLLPSSKSNAIVSRESARKISVSNNYSFREDSQLLNQKKNRPSQWMIIKKQVIKIENFVKRKYVEDVKKQKEEDRLAEQSKRKKREEKLEDKPKADEKLPNIPSLPKLGFLDGIKKFIVNMILGFIAFRLIEHLPKIANFLKILAPAVDFFIDFSGKLLNGLVTFIDWGYKAYDFTRKQLKSFGGENFVKIFDTFNGAVGKVIEAAITTAIVLGSQGKGGVLDVGTDIVSDRVLKRGAQQAATSAASQAGGTAAQAGGIGAGAAGAIVAGAGLLASALGEGAFQLRKFAIKPIQNLENEYKKDKNPLTKIGRGIILNMIKPLFGIFQTAGFLLDVVGSPFRYAIELIRYPFLNEDDKKKQATNLAKFDARIREDLRKAFNMLTLGIAFKDKGSFGNIYGNQGAQKEMVSKMAGGGITRGGKTQGGVKRKVKKPTTKRSITTEPTKLNPGKDAGGLKDIQRVFPKSTNLDTVNPLGYLEESYNKTSKIPFFGSLFGIATKTILGEKPNSLDYKNAAVGLNSWINNTFSGEVLRTGGAFAGGGEVNAEMFMKGEDLTNVIAKSVQENVSSKIDDSINELMKQLMLKDIEKKSGVEGKDQSTGEGDILHGTTPGEYGSILDLIASVEAVGGYDVVNGGKIDGLSKMTISQARQAALRSGGSGAMGRYQQMPQFVLNRARSVGLNPDTDLFNEENQNKLAILLIDGAGYKKWKSGGMSTEQFAHNLSATWRGLPEGPNNLTYQDQYASGNKAHTTWANVIATLSAVKSGKISGGQVGGGILGTGIALGSGYGSAGSKISGELGRFIKSRLQSPAQFQAVTEHPEHGGVRGTHASGSYHYSGRALDIGAYTREQGPILNVIAEFNRMKGVKPVELITGRTDPAGHSDHVHVAYSKGGLVDGVTYAMMGERGREFVFDSNTTETVKAALPGFLESLNSASNVSSVLKVIQAYASYDNATPQEILIDDDQPSMMDYQSQGMNDQSFMMQISQSGGGSDPFQILDRLPG